LYRGGPELSLFYLACGGCVYLLLIE